MQRDIISMFFFSKCTYYFLLFLKSWLVYVTLIPVILYWRLPSVMAQEALEGVLSEGPLSRQEAAGTVPVHGMHTRPAAQD